MTGPPIHILISVTFTLHCALLLSHCTSQRLFHLVHQSIPTTLHCNMSLSRYTFSMSLRHCTLLCSHYTTRHAVPFTLHYTISLSHCTSIYFYHTALSYGPFTLHYTIFLPHCTSIYSYHTAHQSIPTTLHCHVFLSHCTSPTPYHTAHCIDSVLQHCIIFHYMLPCPILITLHHAPTTWLPVTLHRLSPTTLHHFPLHATLPHPYYTAIYSIFCHTASYRSYNTVSCPTTCYTAPSYYTVP